MEGMILIASEDFYGILVDWFSFWLHNNISKKVEVSCGPVYCSWWKLSQGGGNLF